MLMRTDLVEEPAGAKTILLRLRNNAISYLHPTLRSEMRYNTRYISIS